MQTQGWRSHRVEIQDVRVTKGKAAIEEGSLYSYSVTTEEFDLSQHSSWAGGDTLVHISLRVTKTNRAGPGPGPGRSLAAALHE